MGLCTLCWEVGGGDWAAHAAQNTHPVPPQVPEAAAGPVGLCSLSASNPGHLICGSTPHAHGPPCGPNPRVLGVKSFYSDDTAWRAAQGRVPLGGTE